MAKYKVIYHWSDGGVDEEDEYFDSEEDATEAGMYGLSCRQEGAEILWMSNPGDNPYDESDFENDTFEVVEVE